MFDDLEMQAQGLHLQQREAEIEALAEAGYAEVLLASRVHAATGRPLRIELSDGTQVHGRLARAGDGWALLDAGAAAWLVRLDAAVLIEGLGPSALAPELWPMTARLSVRAALRRISAVGDDGTFRLAGGSQVRGRLGRVGADFAELGTATGQVIVATASIIAVQGAR
ncbi:MAG: hypothetical protein NTV23_10995 [Propionibacteriales bacterium]|nr:hypothetical protein [Propionibacteriales bacterium]